jgi:hypothetical protein
VSQRFIMLGGGTGEKPILANRAGRGDRGEPVLRLVRLNAVHTGTPAGEFYDLAAGREIIFT